MAVSSSVRSGGDIARVPVTAETKISVPWSSLVVEHESYIEEKRDKSLVFVGRGRENFGEIKPVPYTHRWTEEYTKRQYARMNDFVRGAVAEYDNPYIVVLPALTASTTDARGDPRPPLDHFDQLKRSWARGVRYELDKVMESSRGKDCWPSRDWEYLQIWEPTTDGGFTPGGYAHLHPVVVCDGRVGAKRFASVMEKHVEKCEWAASEAHDVNEIDIRPLQEFTNPAAYLFKYLGKSWNRVDASDYQKRFDALLYETGYRRFQPSDGAQRWMQREDEGTTQPWTFVGVGDLDQVRYLSEFEDSEDFQVAHEFGVSSYLAGYDRPVTVWSDGCEHDWSSGECLKCGIDGLTWAILDRTV